MYGLDSSGANVAMALTELFLVRFAVNFVEAFTDNRVRAFGKFMVIAAMVYALKETIQDMNDISKGKAIEFFKGVRFSMTYKDYLRIFLLLHPAGDKMTRMMARIEQKSGSNLIELPTYIEGNAAADLRLWFLPGVAEMLGNAGVLDGNVVDGKYRIEKKVIYSY